MVSHACVRMLVACLRLGFHTPEKRAQEEQEGRCSADTYRAWI